MVPFQKPVVLVAPLDWGLGHATRCIPLIHAFTELNAEVIIASDGPQRALLELEFPKLRFVSLKGYGLAYGSSRWQTILKILRQIPKMLRAIRYERAWLGDFLATNRVNAVISDNRYGLFHPDVPCIFVTHQLTIKTPFGFFAENALRRLNYRFIQRFSACWVPDYAGEDNLAAALSHPPSLPSIPVHYLGRLSRLKKTGVRGRKKQVLIILSGPEPQRTLFEKRILDQLKQPMEDTILVRGLPRKTGELPTVNGKVVVYNHLGTAELQGIIAETEIIVSRSGYSTIMDLMGMERKCVFVPTPGQSEQEYLARYLSSKKLCLSYEQHNFVLATALQQAGQEESFSFPAFPQDGYKKVLAAFVAGL